MRSRSAAARPVSATSPASAAACSRVVLAAAALRGRSASSASARASRSATSASAAAAAAAASAIRARAASAASASSPSVGCRSRHARTRTRSSRSRSSPDVEPFVTGRPRLRRVGQLGAHAGGRLLVDHRGVRRHDERHPRCDLVRGHGGGGADGHHRAGQQPGRRQLCAGRRRVGGVVQQNAADQVREPLDHRVAGPGGQHREITPTGVRGDARRLQHAQHVLDLRGFRQETAFAERPQRPLVARLLGEQTGALLLRGGQRARQPLDQRRRVGVRHDLLDAEQRGQAGFGGERVARGSGIPVRGVGLFRGHADDVRGAVRRRPPCVGALPGSTQRAELVGAPPRAPRPRRGRRPRPARQRPRRVRRRPPAPVVRGNECSGTRFRARGPPRRPAPRSRRSVARAAPTAAWCPAASFTRSSSRSRAAFARSRAAAAAPAASSAAATASSAVARRAAPSAAAAACRARSAGRARSCSASTTRRSRPASAIASWWASTGSTASQASTWACAASNAAVAAVSTRSASARTSSATCRRSSVVISCSRRSSSTACASASLRRVDEPHGRGEALVLVGLARDDRGGQRGDGAVRSGLRGPRDPGRPLRLPQRLQPFERALDEVAFGREVGSLGELVRVPGHEIGEGLRFLGIEHRAQQEVDERLVAAERERLGGLALLGVHGSLVAEQLRVQADVDEVARPLAVRGLPHELARRVLAVLLVQPVLERGHRDAAAACGERQVVEAERGPWPERVPGVGQPLRVGGDDVARPLGHLAGDEQLPGAGVHPFARDVGDVLTEHELRQHVGAGRAHHLAAAREQHREHQLEQHRLAAAVLQEQHRRRRGAARHAFDGRRRRTGRPVAQWRARARRHRAGRGTRPGSAHRAARRRTAGPGRAQTPGAPRRLSAVATGTTPRASSSSNVRWAASSRTCTW